MMQSKLTEGSRNGMSKFENLNSVSGGGSNKGDGLKGDVADMNRTMTKHSEIQEELIILDNFHINSYKIDN
jgi:hypothetical protein